ncbi:hypothetical protein LMH87_001370 [Akanthomyces muscarius]|uniref:Uncharacterized protein n=1 Tax=Akanthomyces muscarius TaxID=2231603 RepID=A0A9W8UNG5_AKAMU|nr:hypothetical protein LMH87_001370 [Akanthomyces muscarius]KAJ4156157.1 hypothetical protein LMH87_001370 [Akanthomyces muscarius]
MERNQNVEFRLGWHVLRKQDTEADLEVYHYQELRRPEHFPPEWFQPQQSKVRSVLDSAYQDRVVAVKLKDQGAAQRHRAHSATWTKQQVEASISNQTTTKLVKVVAAHQLKGGDTQIFGSTTAETTHLKQKRE